MGTAQKLPIFSWLEHLKNQLGVGGVCVPFLEVWVFTQSFGYDIPGQGMLVEKIVKIIQTLCYSVETGKLTLSLSVPHSLSSTCPLHLKC